MVEGLKGNRIQWVDLEKETQKVIEDYMDLMEDD